MVVVEWIFQLSRLPRELLDLGIRGIRWCYRRLTLVVFHLKDRKPPFDEVLARQLAQAVLSGSIVRAVPFRNIGSSRTMMAVVRRDTANDLRSHVHLLEKFGETYRLVWSSEDFWGSQVELRVTDLDGDGGKELVFVEESFGTGAGMRIMSVYSTARHQLYQVRELYNWQDAAGPIAPQIEVEPDDDRRFIQAIERFAVSLGLLRANPVDLDNLRYAVQAWHSENGRKRSGPIRLRFYESILEERGSVWATLETRDVIWIAYFKGPLIGCPKRGGFFIAYSPDSMYNWVTCLAYGDDILWFGTHSQEGIMSFEFNGNEGCLRYFRQAQGGDLPVVEVIAYEKGRITINDATTIHASELTESQSQKDLREAGSSCRGRREEAGPNHP